MSGPSDAQPPAGTRPSSGRSPRPRTDRSVLNWVVIPAALGSAIGIFVVVVPWGRHILVFGLVVSGLAWLLRVAGDWTAEHAGPQRGVVLIGSVLFGTWLTTGLVLVFSSPGSVSGGLGSTESSRAWSAKNGSGRWSLRTLRLPRPSPIRSSTSS